MISALGLSHIGIAVPDLEAAATRLQACFGAEASPPKDVPEQGIRIVYLAIGTTTVELLAPTRPDSPVAKFLARNPAGGLHHIAFHVGDAEEAADAARDAGLRIVGPGEPRPGHHGRPIFFVDPKDILGALVEFEEAPTDATPPASA